MPSTFAEIPMQGDFNAPLKVQAPATVDTIGETSRAFKLADQVMQHREKQDDEQDRLQVNDYMKQGGNLSTPEGIMKAAEDLRGKVSAKSYQELIGQAQQSGTWQAKMNEAYAKLPEQQFKQTTSMNELVLQQLERASMAFDEAAKTKGEPAAMEAFNAAKKASLEYVGNLKGPDGKPMIGQDFIASYTDMSPAMVKSMLQTSKFQQDRLKEAAAIRLSNAKAQQIEQGGPEVARLAALEEEFGKDSPEYKAALLKMQGKGGAGAGAGGTGLPASVANLTGDELLAKLPPATAAQVKAISEGRESFADLGIRGAARERMSALVNQYNPNYSSIDYKASQATETAFAKGKEAGMVRSFNVALDHLDTLQKASDALKNKDSKTFNRVANAIGTEFGATAPVDFNAVKRIVGDEIVKAIVGTGGGVRDREEAAKTIDAANSPEQLKSVIARYKDLMRGQLAGLRDQYQRGTKRTDFDERFLSPAARAVAHGGEGEKTAAPKEGDPMKINSPEELKKAVSEGRLKVGGHFVGPGGVDRILKKEPK
jgi:hypothetical protein